MRKIKVVLITLICAVLFSGCQIGDREIKLRTTMPDNELFEMGNLACSPAELKLFLANYKNIYGTIYDTDFWTNCKDVSAMSDKLKAAAFAHLTKVYALDLYAIENGIELDEQEITTCDLLAREYYGSLNQAELTYTGASFEDVSHLVSSYVLAKKAYAVIMDGVDPEVSDDEARIVDAIIIYNTDRAKVLEAYTKSKDTKDFASLAANYSQLSYIETTFGRGEYDEKVENNVFSLDNGEQTGIIEANGGYMMFYCVNKYNEELSEQKKLAILEERKAEALDEIYSFYQEKVTSILNEDAYAKIAVDASLEIGTSNFFELIDSAISYK